MTFNLYYGSSSRDAESYNYHNTTQQHLSLDSPFLINDWLSLSSSMFTVDNVGFLQENLRARTFDVLNQKAKYLAVPDSSSLVLT